MTRSTTQTRRGLPTAGYTRVLADMIELLEVARQAAARTVNGLMTATYWEVGRRIVRFEQEGKSRAAYGERLLDRLSGDLTRRFGRGFARPNLVRARQFYLAFPQGKIRSTPSSKLPGNIRSTVSNESGTDRFPLPWSHYVLLISRSRSTEALGFYHFEALRGGWSVRQLQRQIESQFYERTALSHNKARILTRGARKSSDDAISADEELKDPLVLEFLGLKDEYSESHLEEALILHLEHFLLELGNDFTFVARQRRLRIDDEWYRVDLLFFHRKLRCLVVIDLKLGRFTHADAGQMHLYLNYAREHWTQPDERPPVGLILCAHKGEAMVRYTTENLPNKVVVREYLTALPDERVLAAEVEAVRQRLETRR